ncbi:MAG: hypothetical protein RLZZ262_678 [Bacteroidota bacterium]
MKKAWSNIARDLKTEGSFVQNSAWMFSSSGLSILFQFVFFYVLSRIYAPADYGLFGVFNLYASTLGNLASFGYNQAFVLPKEEPVFQRLLHLTIAISALTCGLFALTMFIWGDQILHVFGHDTLGWQVHLIAPIAFLMAADRITGDWAIRVKSFKNQMWTSVASTVVSRFYNIAHGLFIGPHAVGLVITTGLQHVLRMVLYVRYVIPDITALHRRNWNLQAMLEVAKTYRHYPTFVQWSNVLVIFSGALPPAVLAYYGYALQDIGYYVHALVLLDIPIRLMGSGIASVFTQKAAEIIQNRPEELPQHGRKLFSNMLLISCVFLFIVLGAGEWGYTLVFGEPWKTAGIIAEILAIFYFFRMISSPISAVVFVMHAEKQNFFFHVSLTVVRFITLWWTARSGLDFIAIMGWYAIVNAAWYFIYLIMILQLMRIGLGSILIRTFLITGMILICSIGLRMLIFNDPGPLYQFLCSIFAMK